MKLTKKQQALIDYLTEFLATHNYAPSYREIAAGLGLTSVASVAEHIHHLEAIGAIRKVPGAARSLEVVDLTFPETTALFETRLLSASPADREILQKAAEIIGLELSSTASSAAEAASLKTHLGSSDD